MNFKKIVITFFSTISRKINNLIARREFDKSYKTDSYDRETSPKEKKKNQERSAALNAAFANFKTTSINTPDTPPPPNRTSRSGRSNTR